MKRILWKPAALKDFERLDPQTQQRILEAVERLADEGRGDVRRLRGYEVEWRLRVGDWRVRFSVSGGQIVILRVLPRSAAYR